MKIIGKAFLGVLCMILLFSFSHASDERTPIKVENPEKGVTFQWEQNEKNYMDGGHIGKNDGIFRYIVYVYEVKNKDENPPKEEEFDNLKKLGRLKENSPIKNKSYNINFTEKQKGHKYFLGVQALLYKEVSKDGKPIGEPINKSTISWSCNNDCTNNNPQYVEVSE